MCEKTETRSPLLREPLKCACPHWYTECRQEHVVWIPESWFERWHEEIEERRHRRKYHTPVRVVKLAKGWVWVWS